MDQVGSRDAAGARSIHTTISAETALADGGYDPGYRACACFWGLQPASLVRAFLVSHPDLHGVNVLDAGCGEGKNAAALAQAGASVDAIDISPLALEHAQASWPALATVRWRLADITSPSVALGQYDLVVAYGLLHCLPSASAIHQTVRNLQAHTATNGQHIICAFNDRSQDLRAHPTFSPTLLNHKDYLAFYADWAILTATDSDLHERHPDNEIPHHHSLTRILVQNH
jgi:2-polyprenyl-3-methyl-5-hydroxy-6-metoxy-1,4-benzoquinol methylase